MKVRVSALARPALAIGLTVLLFAAVACGSGDSEDNAAGTSGSAASNAAAVDASGAITIVAKDNFYDPKSFTGPGGQSIKVTLDNKGAAIHDFVRGPRASRLEPGSPGALAARRSAALLARGNAILGIALVAVAVRLARGG